jgi:hypothetical protein
MHDAVRSIDAASKNSQFQTKQKQSTKLLETTPIEEESNTAGQAITPPFLEQAKKKKKERKKERERKRKRNKGQGRYTGTTSTNETRKMTGANQPN